MKVYVDVHDKRWKKHKINFKKIVCTAVDPVYKESEVSIVLVDDAEIHAINKQYRDVDKPTNVLSFELGDDVLLGDIYISYDTVVKEAKQAGISVENHVAHMVVHGVLHLLGHDHITDDEAAVMEMKEIAILKKMGIKNPYDDVVCVDGDCCPGAHLWSFFNKLKVRENSWVQYALYALFGGVAAFGFAPFYMWPLTLLGIAGAYWLTVRNNNIGGFWRTLLRVSPFGAMYAVAMFWWTLHSIYVVPEIADKFAIWTIPGLVGLAVAGVFIFSWPLVVVGRGVVKSAAGRVFLFAATWTLVLWAREWMFTGFPWNPIANISVPYPVIANSMSLWGALGLTFVLVGLIAGVTEFIRNRRNWGAGVFFAMIMCVGMAFGAINMYWIGTDMATVTPVVRIVQVGASQSQKATHNRAQALERANGNIQRLFDLASQDNIPDIVIFPETAYPFVVLKDDVIPLAQQLNRPIIFGANTFNRGGVFNSMVITDEAGQVQHIYSKSHLVPFGEYSPLGILPAPVNLMPGNGPELLSVGDFLFVPAVCYEVVFSDSLLPRGVGHIHAVVNITNDNWFGNTPGTYQHLDMVRRYAIESGLPIIRANYSGISAFVGADGRIISAIPVGESGVLDGFVWGAHVTPYRVIGLNWWMIIILITTICGVIIAERRNK